MCTCPRCGLMAWAASPSSTTFPLALVQVGRSSNAATFHSDTSSGLIISENAFTLGSYADMFARISLTSPLRSEFREFEAEMWDCGRGRSFVGWMKNEAWYTSPPSSTVPQIHCEFGPHQLWRPFSAARGAVRGLELMREVEMLH